ncbi:MAG: hypothetical protein WCA47_16860, partial [Terriglobales bacterium]
TYFAGGREVDFLNSNQGDPITLIRILPRKRVGYTEAIGCVPPSNFPDLLNRVTRDQFLR